MKTVEKHRAIRKGGKQSQEQLSQSNPDIKSKDLSEQQNKQSRHSTNDLVGLGKSNDEKPQKKSQKKRSSKLDVAANKNSGNEVHKTRSRDSTDDLAGLDDSSDMPQKKNHWKTVSKSIQAGDIKKSDKTRELKAEVRKKRSSKLDVAAHEDSGNEIHKARSSDSTDDIADLDESPDMPQKKNHWNTVSKSIQAGDIKKSDKTRELKAEARSDSKDNWKTLANSVKVANEIKRSQTRARDSSEDVNASTDLKSSKPRNDDLRKSSRLTSRQISDDLRRPRRATVDGNMKKLTRSSSRIKGSSDDLRQSKKEAPRKVRGSLEDFNASDPADLLRSRSNDDLRKSSGLTSRRSSDDLRRPRRATVDGNMKKLTRSSSRIKGSSDDLRRSKTTHRLK
jgi:hypothetical protein